jgi:hypothetical protein
MEYEMRIKNPDGLGNTVKGSVLARVCQFHAIRIYGGNDQLIYAKFFLFKIGAFACGAVAVFA